MPARPGETLALWEALASTTPVARGAAVLVALGAADGLADAVRMPLASAARAALGELWERAGPEVQTVVTCPGCRAVLDVVLAPDELLAATRRARAIGGSPCAASARSRIVCARTVGAAVAATGGPRVR